MAHSDPIAGLETQITQVNGQFREIIELLAQSSPPIVTQSTINGFSDVLLKTTEDFESYRQRLSTLSERELVMEKEKRDLEQKTLAFAEKERIFAEKMTKRLELEQQSQKRAQELKKREDELKKKETEINMKERLLLDRTRVIDRRESNIDRLAEDSRSEFEKAFEAQLSLDERKETVVAAEGRAAADEQALERWQDFLQQKHSHLLELHTIMNDLRVAARREHNQAIEELNEELHKAHDIVNSAKALEKSVTNQYQRAKDMLAELTRTYESVLRNYERMLKHIEAEKETIARLDKDSSMLSSTTSNTNRELGHLLDKANELTDSLVVVRSDINEQEARLDTFLGRIGQLIDPSNEIASSPEKGPPAKRQRSSRPVGLAPTEASEDPFTSQTLLPSSQAGPSSGIDPSGLINASEFIKEVWGQIQFPSDWQAHDSNSLLGIFLKNEKKDFHWRPDGTLIRGAKWTKEGDQRSICLIREFSRKKPNFAEGNEKPCDECKKKGGPCVNVSWADEAGEKKWLLMKRK
ncbi:hypothetical protein JMJ35_006948 [Cladonia borealis]|uniref:Uncharacterized protein n=1 Tax=Cladonia borealis TaxID=184061 RepID=A0AA39QZ77_9LECA|nr:hypothetical protein JMJ35_006948 [Cladonia borealis]